ncbi:DUF3168 domain-containing protein [Ensifer sp. ZNC0028]|uniref:DUF3168 domain-containing protein n=1 Tax=Ensifer sp. ZNC0028 TaxID=1339236 RepID=UPI0005BDB0A5|nr:DUF3168 domain-containing protein [Ensifer sp. ZNC0028]
MSPSRELWNLVRDSLLAETAVMAEIDAIYDKVPSKPWGAKKAYISRGPFFGAPDDADCIPGQEITLQIDIWSQKSNRWSVDEIVAAIRAALHERDLQLTENALVELRVTLWRIIDDPDPLTVHGIVQVTALVEEANGT